MTNTLLSCVVTSSLLLQLGAPPPITVLPLASPGSIKTQSHPDLSGKWTLASEKAASFGKEFTITSDATSLRVDYVTSYTEGIVGIPPPRGTPGPREPISTQRTVQVPVRLTYKLDGSESRNAISMSPGKRSEIVSRAAWDVERLVIVTTREVRVQPKREEGVSDSFTHPLLGPSARPTIAAVSTIKQVFWLRPDGVLIVETLSVVDTGLSGELVEPRVTRSEYLKAG
jgi:hypothetical protein